MLESKMKWVLREDIENKQTSIHPSPTIDRMLRKRNIHNKEDAEAFLYPSKQHLHDPLLFEEMEQAIERIQKAIDTNEKILIYGDYDADGVTSTALLVSTLHELGANVDHYIPNRFTEGYGPNELAFQAFKAQDFHLIITVDNGIAAPHEALVAKELGMDLIITDHHEGQDELPDALATIHPKLSKNYPFDHLAGVGVALKLAQALTGKLTDDMLALAAIGTVADLVPMNGENRIIVKEGLKALKHTKMPGMMALKNVGKLQGDLASEDIGFVLGPRLNAVGRLQDASLAVDLLLEKDPVLATEMALEIEQLNQERQKLVQEITKEVKEMIDKDYKDDQVFVIAKEGWNPGVLGIVASRIVNQYHKPTLMFSIDSAQKVMKGSARSIPAFDMFQTGMAHRDLFIHFGGHPQAAGMTVDADKIDELRQAMNETAHKQLTDADFQPSLQIEEIIEWKEVDLAFPDLIESMAPFGMNNERPIFQISNVKIKDLRKIGAKKNHLKLTGQTEDKQVEAVGFQIGDSVDRLTAGSTIDLVGEIQINEWNGNRKLQVLLKDLRCQEWQLFDYRGRRFELPASIAKNEALAVYFDEHQPTQIPNVQSIHAGQLDLSDRLNGCKHLIIADVPSQLEDVEEVLKLWSYQSLYLCYPTNDSTYFDKFPSRESFKSLYVTIKKHQVIQKDQRQLLAEAKKISIDQLNFVIQVFFDLDFVKIIDGDVFFVENSMPKDLSHSSTYKERLNRIEMEKIMYYANYQELKEWISMRQDWLQKEGEVLHGL